MSRSVPTSAHCPAALLLCLLLSGCLTERAERILALNGDAVAGSTNFCWGYCHGNTDRGPPLEAGAYAKELVVMKVLEGGISMPPMGETMDDQEIADVAAWLSGE
jgi:Cytochrome C oxidase, cbb3-type, subunit III